MAKKNTIPEATTDEALNVVTEAPVAETAVEEIAAPVKKVKRRKSRTTEELHELPYSKGWTDAETRAYINYLRVQTAANAREVVMKQLVSTCYAIMMNMKEIKA